MNNSNKNKKYNFFIQAESSGGEFAYKSMKLIVIDNIAPFFKGFRAQGKRTFNPIKITVDKTNADDSEIVKVILPVVKDLEGNKILYKFTNAKAKWIKKLSKNANGKFVLKVDKSKIKLKDAGTTRIGIRLRDDKYSKTRLENNYYLPVVIKYIEAKPVVAEKSAADNSTAAANGTASAANGTATATTADSGNATADATAADNSTAATAESGNATATATVSAVAATAADSNSTAAAADTTTDTATAATKKAAVAAEPVKGTTVETTVAADGTVTKETKVRSGGQLGNVVISTSGGKTKKTKKKKKEVIKITSLPISAQVLAPATANPPVKAFVKAMTNPL